jgi:Tfp pilus assembly protein PilF
LGLLEAQAGEFEKAAALFKEAASHPGKHVPASHNNYGVMLVQLGFLKEAEKEFDTALKASNGSLAEAAHNLNLCHSLTSRVFSSGWLYSRLRLSS